MASGKADKAKGRMEKAVGDLTDDRAAEAPRRERRGRRQAEGHRRARHRQGAREEVVASSVRSFREPASRVPGREHRAGLGSRPVVEPRGARVRTMAPEVASCGEGHRSSLLLPGRWRWPSCVSWPGPRRRRARPPGVLRPDRPIVLFDGRRLDAFETWLVDSHREDPDRVFSVVDQVDGAPALRISGQRWGGIVTRESFRDYRLVVEFRWGLATWGERRNAARDSGVLVHCQGVPGNTGRDGNGPWMRSIEAQVIEGGVGDFILVAGFEPDGRRVQPSLVATAGVDRDDEPVFDPNGAPRDVRRRPGQLVRPRRRLEGRARASAGGRTSRARTASGRASR